MSYLRIDGRARERIKRPLIRFACAVLVGLVAVSCGPAPNHPAHGEITVKFEDASDSDGGFSEITFTLSNGTDHPIYVRGERTFLGAVRMSRPEVEVFCMQRERGSTDEMGLGFGFADRDKRTIKISAGDHLRVIIPTRPMYFYKNGSCYMQLTLNDGTTVELSEFRP